MAPWVPTRSKDIERLVKLLELKKWEKFLEIWCGDGRVSHAVASAFPAAHITGIEIAFPIYIFAKLRLLLTPQKNYTLKLANAFKQDLSFYDVIYVYGMPDKMSQKIVPKFLSQAKPGAKLYSYVFSIPEEFQKHAISYGDEDEAKIHILEKK